VSRSIELIFRNTVNAADPSNVLCFGYRKVLPSPGNRPRGSPLGVCLTPLVRLLTSLGVCLTPLVRLLTSLGVCLTSLVRLLTSLGVCLTSLVRLLTSLGVCWHRSFVCLTSLVRLVRSHASRGRRRQLAAATRRCVAIPIRIHHEASAPPTAPAPNDRQTQPSLHPQASTDIAARHTLRGLSAVVSRLLCDSGLARRTCSPRHGLQSG
jgi:hypothetical protein